MTIVERPNPDEQRRQAITKWWERQTLIEFIARKREALTVSRRSSQDG